VPPAPDTAGSGRADPDRARAGPVGSDAAERDRSRPPHASPALALLATGFALLVGLALTVLAVAVFGPDTELASATDERPIEVVDSALDPVLDDELTDREGGGAPASSGRRSALAARSTSDRAPIVDPTHTASLRGRLLGPGGVPLADQVVTAQRHSRFAGTRTTDADGAFAFEGLERGVYFLSLDEERVPQQLHANLGHAGRFARLSLFEGEGFEDDFQLSTAASLEIVVLDERGEPLRNQHVRVLSREHARIESARTDASGRALATDLLPGTWEVAVPVRRGLEPVPQQVELVEGAAGRVTISLATGGGTVVDGRLIDLDGRVVADAQIELVGLYESRMRPRFDARTDRYGRFEVGRLPAGSYRVVLCGGSRWNAPDPVVTEARERIEVPDTAQWDLGDVVAHWGDAWVLDVEYAIDADWARANDIDLASQWIAFLLESEPQVEPATGAPDLDDSEEPDEPRSSSTAPTEPTLQFVDSFVSDSVRDAFVLSSTQWPPGHRVETWNTDLVVVVSSRTEMVDEDDYDDWSEFPRYEPSSKFEFRFPVAVPRGHRSPIEIRVP